MLTISHPVIHKKFINYLYGERIKIHMHTLQKIRDVPFQFSNDICEISINFRHIVMEYGLHFQSILASMIYQSVCVEV